MIKPPPRLRISVARVKAKNKGFTLTEIAIVLGIIGLILGAIWVAAASVYNNQRVAHAQTAVLQLAQATRTLYTAQNVIDTAGSALDITTTLLNAGVTPSDLGAASPLTGPFPNGQTGVIGTKDGNGFVIAMSGLSQANCVALLSAVAGQTRDPGLFNADAVASVAPATTDATSTGAPLAGPVTPSAAAAAATGTATSSGTGGCTNANNKVRFGFTLK